MKHDDHCYTYVRKEVNETAIFDILNIVYVQRLIPP